MDGLGNIIITIITDKGIRNSYTIGFMMAVFS